MSWIHEVPYEQADSKLKPVYDRLIAQRGKISNILKVHSLNPQALQDHLNLYMGLMFGPSGLKRAERETIAVVVSRADNCDYCVNHHREALARYLKDENRLEALCGDYTQAELSPRLRAICDYAHKLTTAPGQQSEADIELLRQAGLSDDEILDVTLITAYFNFVNRIALGLGVAFSAEEMTGYKDNTDANETTK